MIQSWHARPVGRAHAINARQTSTLLPAAQTQHQVQRRLLLDVVVRERATVLKLLAREDQALLVRGNALLILDFALDVVNSVAALHF
jgi:hypothetical protein